jgi:hypothetical protein
MIALAVPEPPAPPASAAPLALVCRVEVAGAWVDWSGRDAALARLGALLAHWWAAWELPAVPALTWAAAAVPDGTARLSVDGADAGHFVRLPALDGAEVEAVAAALFEGAVAHRSAWLTDTLLRHLGVARDDDALVREGARRGFAPRRFIGVAAAEPPTTPAARCDRCIDASALRLRLQMADPALCHQPGDNESWAELTELLGEALFYESGMLLPMLEVEADASLPPNGLRVWINDLPLAPQRGLGAGRVMVNQGFATLIALAIGADPLRHPADGSVAALASAADLPALSRLGFMTWGPGGYALLVVVAAARRHAAAWWTATATEAALARLSEGFPHAVAAWRARFAPALLGEVLRALLAERVGIRNLRAILEAMLAVRSVVAVDGHEQIVFAPPAGRVLTVDICRPGAPATLDTLTLDDWIGHVRCALARQISHQYTRGQSTLVVWLLDRGVERQLRDNPDAFAGPEGHARLFTALHTEIAGRGSGQPVVLLTGKSVRPLLQRALGAELPELVVLAFEELTPQTNIQPIGSIELAD